jgi:hypothetical protein
VLSVTGAVAGEGFCIVVAELPVVIVGGLAAVVVARLPAAVAAPVGGGFNTPFVAGTVVFGEAPVVVAVTGILGFVAGCAAVGLVVPLAFVPVALGVLAGVAPLPVASVGV